MRERAGPGRLMVWLCQMTVREQTGREVLDQLAALVFTDDLEAIRSRHEQDRRLAVPRQSPVTRRRVPVEIRIPG